MNSPLIYAFRKNLISATHVFVPPNPPVSRTILWLDGPDIALICNFIADNSRPCGFLLSPPLLSLELYRRTAGKGRGFMIDSCFKKLTVMPTDSVKV